MGIMYCCGGSHSTWQGRELGGVTKELCNQFGNELAMRSNFWRDIFTKKSRQKLCEKENQVCIIGN